MARRCRGVLLSVKPGGLMVVLPGGDTLAPFVQEGDQKGLQLVILQGMNGGRQRCFRSLLIHGLHHIRQRALETTVRMRHLLTFFARHQPAFHMVKIYANSSGGIVEICFRSCI